jgi:hypothetical protein
MNCSIAMKSLIAGQSAPALRNLELYVAQRRGEPKGRSGASDHFFAGAADAHGLAKDARDAEMESARADLQAAQWSVGQAAAIMVEGAGTARRRGTLRGAH